MLLLVFTIKQTPQLLVLYCEIIFFFLVCICSKVVHVSATALPGLENCIWSRPKIRPKSVYIIIYVQQKPNRNLSRLLLFAWYATGFEHDKLHAAPEIDKKAPVLCIYGGKVWNLITNIFIFYEGKYMCLYSLKI